MSRQKRRTARLGRLVEMLGTGRPAGSAAEAQWRRRWLGWATEDGGGNLHYVVPQADGTPSQVLWTAHTDTVHRVGGAQRLVIDVLGRVALAQGERATCLGADDTTGCWLLREMVFGGVPGHYVWCHGEEVGCEGSSWLAKHEPGRLAGIRYAIAMDRPGTGEVITHQRSSRCCSDAFATSLAAQLTGPGLPAHRLAHGVYTDTAELVHLIGECTNVSVGYTGQHGQGEVQDTRYALALLDALLGFDETALVAERDPAARESFAALGAYWWDTSSSHDGVEDWDLRAIYDRYSFDRAPASRRYQ